MERYTLNGDYLNVDTFCKCVIYEKYQPLPQSFSWGGGCVECMSTP